MRLGDWQIRLAALVEDRLHQPFAWGVRDCCLWAADAVLAVTGVDPAHDIRGTYDSKETAGEVFRRLRGIESVCDERLGERVLPAMGQPGDVGLFNEDGPALAVNVGSCWMAQGQDGLKPINGVSIAWRCC